MNPMRSGRRIRHGLALAVLVVAGSVTTAPAQTFGPDFTADYSFLDLGVVPGLPPFYGGLTLLPGDPNTLLIGGNANTFVGDLYTIGVVRDGSGHITGFSGPATFFAEAQYNDGGVVYGPGGVLFASQWPVNMLGQYLPGSSAPDKVIDLAALGVADSHSALNFVPAGFGGAGEMKLVSYIGGEFYTATFAPDGLGTFDILSVVQETTLPGGPEGFVYVAAGSPGFAVDSMLVSEYAADRVSAYDIDGNGNPIAASRRDFLTGLTGAEGAFIDPLTGDFLFSTFGGSDRVFVVQGLLPPASVPEPSTLLLLGCCATCVVGRTLVVRRRARLA